MVRLQHFMTSSPNKFSYDALCKLQKDDKNEFALWRKTMEKAIGREFKENNEYKKYYKELYNQFKR